MSKEIKVNGKAVSVEDVIRRVILDKALRDEFGSGDVVVYIVDRETNKPTKVPNIIRVGGEHNSGTMSAFDKIIKATHDKDTKVVVSKCNKQHEDDKSVVLTKLDKLQKSYKDFSNAVNISVPELHRLVDTYRKEDVNMCEAECSLADLIKDTFERGLVSGVTNIPVYPEFSNGEDGEFNVFKSLAHALKNIKADVAIENCTIDFEEDCTNGDVLKLIEGMKNSLTEDKKLCIRINESNLLISMKRISSMPDVVVMQVQLQTTGVKYRNLLLNVRQALKLNSQVTIDLDDGSTFVFNKKDFRKGLVNKVEESNDTVLSVSNPGFIKRINNTKEMNMVIGDNTIFKIVGCDSNE